MLEVLGLSAIGGTIRRGELIGPDPIQHALKLNLFANQYLSYTIGANGGLGYRWPANSADSYADPALGSPRAYEGTTPGLMMGSLLAIPPNATLESLGITTPAGEKLFYALQNYGGYVADDTGWDTHDIGVEHGVIEEFEAHYGYSFDGSSGSFYDDVMALFSNLHIIDNNSADNIGGGGAPRVPLAPELDDSGTNLERGDDGDNVLVGSDLPDALFGETGNDQLSGAGGSDSLYGGIGNDVLQGNDGNDHLFGEDGADILEGGNGNDYLKRCWTNRCPRWRSWQ